MNEQTSKKKWLMLGAVGVALLLIPRRSSRQQSPRDQQKPSQTNETHHAQASKNSTLE